MHNKTSFYTKDELEGLGLKKFGENVLISRKSSLYGVENISIGNNVRIDDFTIISGMVNIKDYVHIAAYTALYGGKFGIILDDFVTLSSRIVIYAVSDDFSGRSLTYPPLPEKYRKAVGGAVVLKKHVLIGSGCTILPNCTIGSGACVGAMSLIKNDLDGWGIYVGIPAKWIKNRSKEIEILEQKLIMEKELSD